MSYTSQKISTSLANARLHFCFILTSTLFILLVGTVQMALFLCYLFPSDLTIISASSTIQSLHLCLRKQHSQDDNPCSDSMHLHQALFYSCRPTFYYLINSQSSPVLFTLYYLHNVSRHRFMYIHTC